MEWCQLEVSAVPEFEERTEGEPLPSQSRTDEEGLHVPSITEDVGYAWDQAFLLHAQTIHHT